MNDYLKMQLVLLFSFALQIIHHVSASSKLKKYEYMALDDVPNYAFSPWNQSKLPSRLPPDEEVDIVFQTPDMPVNTEEVRKICEKIAIKGVILLPKTSSDHSKKRSWKKNFDRSNPVQLRTTELCSFGKEGSSINLTLGFAQATDHVYFMTRLYYNEDLGVKIHFYFGTLDYNQHAKSLPGNKLEKNLIIEKDESAEIRKRKKEKAETSRRSTKSKDLKIFNFSGMRKNSAESDDSMGMKKTKTLEKLVQSKKSTTSQKSKEYKAMDNAIDRNFASLQLKPRRYLSWEMVARIAFSPWNPTLLPKREPSDEEIQMTFQISDGPVDIKEVREICEKLRRDDVRLLRQISPVTRKMFWLKKGADTFEKQWRTMELCSFAKTDSSIILTLGFAQATDHHYFVSRLYEDIKSVHLSLEHYYFGVLEYSNNQQAESSSVTNRQQKDLTTVKQESFECN